MRRRGLGRRVIDELERIARRRGYAVVDSTPERSSQKPSVSSRPSGTGRSRTTTAIPSPVTGREVVAVTLDLHAVLGGFSHLGAGSCWAPPARTTRRSDSGSPATMLSTSCAIPRHPPRASCGRGRRGRAWLGRRGLRLPRIHCSGPRGEAVELRHLRRRVTNQLTIRPERLERLRQICLAQSRCAAGLGHGVRLVEAGGAPRDSNAGEISRSYARAWRAWNHVRS